MTFVIGRQGSGADIQVPPGFNFVSRLHARISAFPGGRYLLEDLNSSNGTFVLAHGMWEQVSAAPSSTPPPPSCLPTTRRRLPSCCAACTRRRSGRRSRRRPSRIAWPRSAQCRSRASRPRLQRPRRSQPADGDGDELPVEPLLKMAGLGDLMRVLTTLHVPLRGIRQLVDRGAARRSTRRSSPSPPS